MIEREKSALAPPIAPRAAAIGPMKSDGSMLLFIRLIEMKDVMGRRLVGQFHATAKFLHPASVGGVLRYSEGRRGAEDGCHWVLSSSLSFIRAEAAHMARPAL